MVLVFPIFILYWWHWILMLHHILTWLPYVLRFLPAFIRQSFLIYLTPLCYGIATFWNSSMFHLFSFWLNLIFDYILFILTMYSDFLTRSYDIGGVISVMALSSLFIIMTKYGLEYPNFYEKLYALLIPSIFMAKHRSKFFQVMLITTAVSIISYVNLCNSSGVYLY